MAIKRDWSSWFSFQTFNSKLDKMARVWCMYTLMYCTATDSHFCFILFLEAGAGELSQHFLPAQSEERSPAAEGHLRLPLCPDRLAEARFERRGRADRREDTAHDCRGGPRVGKRVSTARQRGAGRPRPYSGESL